MGTKRARINVAVQQQKLGICSLFNQKVVLVTTVSIDVRIHALAFKLIFLTLVYCSFSASRHSKYCDQNKNQNHSIDKVQNLGTESTGGPNSRCEGRV